MKARARTLYRTVRLSKWYIIYLKYGTILSKLYIGNIYSRSIAIDRTQYYMPYNIPRYIVYGLYQNNSTIKRTITACIVHVQYNYTECTNKRGRTTRQARAAHDLTKYVKMCKPAFCT